MDIVLSDMLSSMKDAVKTATNQAEEAENVALRIAGSQWNSPYQIYLQLSENHEKPIPMPSDIFLTPEETEMAKACGLTPAEYATNKRKEHKSWKKR